MEWVLRWLGGRRDAVDAALSLALLLLIGYAIIDPPGPASPWPAWSAWLVAAVVAVPVAGRRRWPQAAVLAACAAAVLATVLGAVGAGVVWISFIPTALALYCIASGASRRRSVAALVACLIGASAAILFFYRDVLPTLPPAPYRSELPPYWPVEIGVSWAAMTIAWAVGRVVRWRRETTARLTRQLAHAAVVDERLRISRELHDVIGHSMSLIAVKATVANHVADAKPEEARAALAVIEQTSRSTLVEIRRVLCLLRANTDPHEALMPGPGLSGLTALAERARQADVDVELTVRDDGALPEAVGLSVFRIVQEALTNVVIHAAPTRCEVSVETGNREVTIEVTDTGSRRHGRRPPAPGGGHGLIGMRERVMMYGGAFTAGSHPGGGFRVSARLPYHPPGESA